MGLHQSVENIWRQFKNPLRNEYLQVSAVFNVIPRTPQASGSNKITSTKTSEQHKSVKVSNADDLQNTQPDYGESDNDNNDHDGGGDGKRDGKGDRSWWRWSR